MDFLVINDTKLKVSMTEEECSRYNIDTRDSEISALDVKLAIKEILDIASERVGFFREGEKILVQIYPMPSGGCEIFITKLKGVGQREKEVIERDNSLTTIDTRVGVYRFSDRNTLKRAARAIYREGIECDVYRCSDGMYYISIREELTDGISEFEILIEYGVRLKSLPLHVSSEYGVKVAEKNGLDFAISEE